MKISNPLMRGFYSGLIGGGIGALVYVLSLIPQTILGLPTGSVSVLDLFKFENLIALLGYGIPSNGIWGSIYGIVYSRFYDRVPGKGVKKGIVWGCMIFFISNFWITSSNFLLFLYTGIDQYFILGYGWILAFAIWFTFGVVLGVLYERWK